MNHQASIEKQEVEREVKNFVQRNQNSLVGDTVSFFERIDPIIHILKTKLENQISSKKIGFIKSKPFRVTRIIKGDFQCLTCKKCFVRKGNYENHIRNHIIEKMTIANEKSLMCKFCQYCAMLMSEFISYPHNRQARDRVMCKFCSKHFNLSAELIQHVADHCVCKPNQLYGIFIEKKRFMCRVCSRMFDRRFNLKRHLRVHRCFICRMKFVDDVPCKHIASFTNRTVG